MIVRQDLGRVMGKHFQLNCLLVFALYVAFVKLLIYTSSLLFTEAYADKLLACDNKLCSVELCASGLSMGTQLCGTQLVGDRLLKCITTNWSFCLC